MKLNPKKDTVTPPPDPPMAHTVAPVLQVIPRSSRPAVDDRNLVLCDANDIEHARIKGSQDFRVTHDGVMYEHCATDEAGRWHYRPML